MSKRKAVEKQRRNERRKAIQSVMGQLGWNAKPRDVVALLENFGVDVGEGMIQRLRFRMTKFWSETRLRKETSRMRRYCPAHAYVHKTPAPRSHAR